MTHENDPKSRPWPDDSRREASRTAPAWVQVRAGAWPPEPIDDQEDPVDDDGESPTTVSWGFPGNPLHAPTSAPAIAAFGTRADPRAPRAAPVEPDPIVGVAPVARRVGRQSSLGTSEFLDRAPPEGADRSASPRAYYSTPGARAEVPEPRVTMGTPRDGRSDRRQDDAPPDRQRPPQEGTGPQPRRRPVGEQEYDEKGTDVGFGNMRAAPVSRAAAPPRTVTPMPAPSAARMFDDDEAERSDAWSTYSPPKSKRGRVGPGAPPPVVPSRAAPAAAGGMNLSNAARILAAVAGLTAAAGLIVWLLPERTAEYEVAGEAPMLPVVGGPIPTADPPAPFDIAAPAAFRPQLVDGKDLSPDAIPQAIADAVAAGKIDLAAAYADKLARLGTDPSAFYPLGELLARNGQVDAAFYWLVRGIREHGVRPERLVERDAFAALWRDARWDAFARWSVQVRRYQTAKGSAAPRIILPASIEAAVALDAPRRTTAARARPGKGNKPTLPVLFWFDGADGTGAQTQAWGQQVADELGVIVVNVLGPDRVGPLANAWSGDPARDRAQVDAALAAVSSVIPDPSRRLAAGAGQGGTWAVELTMRDPTFLAGALALHPTDEWRGPRDTSAESNRDRKQVVTLFAGGKDDAEHSFLRVERGRLLRAGVDTTMEIDEQPWPGGAPSDLKARLTTWVRARLSPAAPAAPAPGVPSVPSP